MAFGLSAGSAALIGGGMSLAGAVIGSNAAQSAGETQAGAANNATASQRQMFDIVNAQQAPYRQAGSNALNSISSFMGIGGPGGASSAPVSVGGMQYRQGGTTGWQANIGGQWTDLNPATTDFNALQQAAAASPSSASADPNAGMGAHVFNAEDLKTSLAPNYQFILDQGLGATKNAANLQGGLVSGNTLKAINDYAQGTAGNAYQNAFNNYNTNQTNIFNRLSSIAGLGQTATNNTGTAATATGQGIGASQIAAGAAQASGTVGSANAINSGLSNANSWYQLSNIMNNPSAGSAYNPAGSYDPGQYATTASGGTYGPM